MIELLSRSFVKQSPEIVSNLLAEVPRHAEHLLGLLHLLFHLSLPNPPTGFRSGDKRGWVTRYSTPSLFFFVHTITPPPPCFTVGIMHVETISLSFLYHTKTRRVEPNI